MENFLQNVEIAKKNIRKIFAPTPLQFSELLSKKYNANIFLKREDLTPVRSYKIRGAFHFISEFLKKNNQKQTFVCASAGNHAQGFAFACAYFEIPGIIFMPTTTPQQKISRTKFLGGDFVEINLVGDTFDEASTEAKKFYKTKNLIFVPPFDHEKIIEGQSTIATEILEHFEQISKNIDFLIIPVGGGGVAAGMSEYFKIKSPKTKIICAEPEGAPSLSKSLEKNKIITLKQIDGFVDGAAVKQIGKIPFDLLSKNIKEKISLCPENRICKTILSFLFYDGIILEPAGALSIDALKDMSLEKIKNKNIVCIISGGNFDFERLLEVKERAMKFSGKKKYFILRLPQRPGALKEFLNCLGPEDDISRFEYLKKSAKEFGSVLLGIESKNSKNFEILTQKIKAKSFKFKDITNDKILADFII